MGRLGWTLVLMATFVLGITAGGLSRSILGTASEVKRLQGLVERQEEQIGTLQARLRRGDTGPQRPGINGTGARREAAWNASIPSAVTQPDAPADLSGSRRTGGFPRSGSREGPGSSGNATRAPAGTPATVDAALDRFYRFLDDTNGTGAGRWARMREVADDLRNMGAAGIEALMRVLASGTGADERRAAAQLLGDLQAAQAVPLLQGILAEDGDVLLRRAAASALGRLGSPDTIPALQSLLANPAEDRFVRMSAAVGLARQGQADGVAGLTEIFAESNADGRGRDMAFRALISLHDERTLPFMRQVASSSAEPGYRVQAIRFLASQGDQQALPALQQIMRTSSEQPSIRDAASQAYATIAGR